jgi:Na+:H+ antiporter, NhaA family
VPTSPRLSLKEFQEIGIDMMKRFRTAQSEGDTNTAYRLLGSFEQLLHATESPSERATRKLNDWVSFVVLPLFALSNAGVTFSGGAAKGVLTSHIAWGIVAGLVLGKPLGIVGFSIVAVKMGVARLPRGVSWLQMAAVGILAGIGFTVSIFISSLAFDNATQLMEAKTAVLGASLVAGLVGYFALRREAKRQPLLGSVATGE